MRRVPGPTDHVVVVGAGLSGRLPGEHVAALGGFGRLDGRIGRFIADDRLRRAFSFQALYADAAPARALGAGVHRAAAAGSAGVEWKGQVQ